MAAKHCPACGNPDCPTVALDPFFKVCPAVRVIRCSSCGAAAPHAGVCVACMAKGVKECEFCGDPVVGFEDGDPDGDLIDLDHECAGTKADAAAAARLEAEYA